MQMAHKIQNVEIWGGAFILSHDYLILAPRSVTEEYCFSYVHSGSNNWLVLILRIVGKI